METWLVHGVLQRDRPRQHKRPGAAAGDAHATGKCHRSKAIELGRHGGVSGAILASGVRRCPLPHQTALLVPERSVHVRNADPQRDHRLTHGMTLGQAIEPAIDLLERQAVR